jgi:hypothetical protein
MGMKGYELPTGRVKPDKIGVFGFPNRTIQFCQDRQKLTPFKLKPFLRRFRNLMDLRSQKKVVLRITLGIWLKRD